MSQKTSGQKTTMLAAFHRALAHLEFDNEIQGPDYLSHFFLPSFKRFILSFKF